MMEKISKSSAQRDRVTNVTEKSKAREGDREGGYHNFT